jgi:hypothetical protein
MTKLRKWFRRQYKRLKVKLHIWERGTSWFKAPKDSTGYENITTAIVRKMINHPDSKFTIAPLSGKRYIVNKTLDIFIIMEYGKVEITNHVYHYVSNLGQRDIEKLTKLYDTKVETERVNYEDQIKSQISNTLQSIYDKISKQSPIDSNTKRAW